MMDDIQEGDALYSLPILVLVGPTAVGKTALSLQIAKEFGFEIISMDSMQVYRYMDIGTAKASSGEREQIRHHLIDIVDPDSAYDAVCFRRDALRCIREIESRGKLPMLTGGTGLYLEVLLNGIFPDVPADEKIRKELKDRLDKEGCEKLHKELSLYDDITAQRIHPHDTQRLLRGLEIYLASGKPWSEHIRCQAAERAAKRARFPNVLQIGLTCAREKLYQHIDMRSELMIEMGLEDEVRQLRAMGFGPELKSMQSIGYRHMNAYLAAKYDRNEMLRLLARDTRRYAKRQYTWFGRNSELHWCAIEQQPQILKKTGQWLQGIL